MIGKLFTTLFFLMMLTLMSCNPAFSPLPSVINIENYTVETRIEQGSDELDFNNIYVYQNETFLGAWPIPALIPTQINGVSEMLFFPGINENGISQRPIIYPMIEPFRINVEIAETSTSLARPS